MVVGGGEGAAGPGVAEEGEAEDGEGEGEVDGEGFSGFAAVDGFCIPLIRAGAAVLRVRRELSLWRVGEEL